MNKSNNNTGRWHPHVTVAAIAERDGKYLLVREKYRGNSVINQPAGHLEQGESLEQAVIRETREETGWQFQPKHITAIYQFVASNDETYIRFAFQGTLIDCVEDPILDPVIEAVVWLGKSEVEINQAELRNPVVLKCIMDYEAGSRLPYNGLQTLELGV